MEPDSDSRRPERVTFTSSLTQDLARRDFTINAMAYHPAKGLIDPFGGKHDLQQKTIRCVGNARSRFEEDALRILRALRFSSTLNFSNCPGHSKCIVGRKRETMSYLCRTRTGRIDKITLRKKLRTSTKSIWYRFSCLDT